MGALMVDAAVAITADEQQSRDAFAWFRSSDDAIQRHRGRPDARRPSAVGPHRDARQAGPGHLGVRPVTSSGCARTRDVRHAHRGGLRGAHRRRCRRPPRPAQRRPGPPADPSRGDRDGIVLAATRVRTLHRPGAGTARRGGSSPDATPNRSPITTRRSVAPGPQRSHSPTSSRSRPPHAAPCAAGNRRRRSACTIVRRTCAPSTAWRPHPTSEPPASSSSTAPGPRRSADRGSAQLDLDLPQLCGDEGAPGGSGSGHDAIGVAHGAWQ